MTQLRVAECDSNSDNDGDHNPSNNKVAESSTLPKQNRNKWIPIGNYNEKEEAMLKLKTDGFWSIKNTNNTSEGKRVYYRCNKNGEDVNVQHLYICYNTVIMKVFQYFQQQMNINTNNQVQMVSI